jgi:hypothetical protein
VYLENENVNVKTCFRNDTFAKRCCFPTYKLVSSRVHAAIPRVDFPGESAASAALSASMLEERRCSNIWWGPGSTAQAGVGGGSGSLSSSGAEDARQGGKEEVTGKSKRGVRGIDSELRGVLPARGVLEPSEKRCQQTVGKEA